MPTFEHLVLCDGLDRRREGRTPSLSLALHGASFNVSLEIADISKPLLANIPDALADLLEIASYVYAADSAIPRGGTTDAQMGTRWRRNFRFVIPVRLPKLWSSNPVSSALVDTLSFLSEDDYSFEFKTLVNAPAVTSYFEYPISEETGFMPDEVILFSGGLDSFAGTVEALAASGKKVALVSHRSAPKIVDAQRYLVERLRDRFGADRIIHIPIWATLRGRLTKEVTHRTRSFLFAALSAVVARLFNRDRICFYENGVTSLNLPPVAQIVGARATRTTHPQALAGFRRVLSNAFGRPFEVDNPYLWLTKAEVIQRIAANGFGDLIRDTRSCTRVRDMTTLHPHCGQCSQCIDRRFAIIAARQDREDPTESYKVDLFLGERQPAPDREMALAYVRSASLISQMTDAAFFQHYGETSRVVDYFPEPTDTAARSIFDLYRRHATAVCRVFEDTIRLYAPRLREGSLPADCLLSLIVSQRKQSSAYPAPSEAVKQVLTAGPEIRMAIDATQRRVIFDQWGEIGGAGADLIIALAETFRDAMRRELAPERYPFTRTDHLIRQIECVTEEALRKRVLRCRNKVTQLAARAGHLPPLIDAVIESSQWHGYRLNPDRIRIVAVSELSASE